MSQVETNIAVSEGLMHIVFNGPGDLPSYPIDRHTRPFLHQNGPHSRCDLLTRDVSDENAILTSTAFRVKV